MVGDVVNGLWDKDYKDEVEACVIGFIGDILAVMDCDNYPRTWRVHQCTLVRRAARLTEPSELDTLREKLRAAEAKLEAVREVVRQ